MKKYLVEYFENSRTFKHSHKYFDTDIEVIDFIKKLEDKNFIVLELDSLGYYVLNSIFWDFL